MATFEQQALAITRSIHPDQLYDWIISISRQADVGGNAFLDGGNAFGALATLGTTDAFPLAIETVGVERARFTAIATPGVPAGAFALGTTTPHALFHNDGTFGFTTLTIADLPAGGSIGPANTTVDVRSVFLVQQTTNAGQVITIPAPTDSTAGRVVYVTNIGTKSFTMLGQTVGTTQTLAALWTGSAWAPSGIGTAVPGWVQGGNAFGALGVLGTTDAFDMSFVAGTQTALELGRNGGAPDTRVRIVAGVAGVSPTIGVAGTAATLGLTLTTKGAGLVDVKPAADSTSAFAVTIAAGGHDVFNVDTFSSSGGAQGRVGIGITAPTQSLDVRGTALFQANVGNDSTTLFQILKSNGSTGVVVDTASGPFPARVGINQAPTTELDVLGSIQASALVKALLALESNEVRDTNGNAWLTASPTPAAVNALGVTNSATGNPVQIAPTGGDVNCGLTVKSRGAAPMLFQPGSDLTSAFEIANAAGTLYVRGDSVNGRVGIGSAAAPLHELDVTGTGRFSTAVKSDTYQDDSNGVTFLTASTVGGNNNRFVMSSSTGNAPIGLSSAGAGANVGITYTTKGTGTHLFQPSTDTLTAFEVAQAGAGAVILSVDSVNQRVGVGQTTPLFALDVTGVGRFTTAVRTPQLNDTASLAWLTSTATASAVNNLNVTNAATGTAPTLSAVGSNANVGINYVTKGTGIHLFRPGTDSLTAFEVAQAGAGAVILSVDSSNQRVGIGQTTPLFALDVTGVGRFTTAVRTPQLNDTASLAWLTSTATASAVNNLNIANAATANKPTLSAVGTDANIGLLFVTKGTGAQQAKPGTDSTDAWELANAAGTVYARADSSNQRLGLGASTAPGFTLDVTGIAHASSNLKLRDVIRNINPTTHTTTSSSYATIETSGAITFSGRPVMFQVSISARDDHGGTNEFFIMQFAVRIDAGADNTIAFIEGNIDGDHRVGSGYVILTPSAGSHTIDLRWKRVSGAGTMTIDGNDFYLLSGIDLD